MIDQTNLHEHFARVFGVAPDVLVRSPGRVNLIGLTSTHNPFAWLR